MRILIPYAGPRHPLTVAGAPPGAEWHDVGGDPHAYWRLLRGVWAQGESFLVIEHDVVCRPDVLDQLAACPEPWCTFGYDDFCHRACQEAWANMLGCTRFRAELIAAAPDAVSSIPAELRDWHNLCDHIAGDKVNGTPAPLRPGSLRAAGFTHHWHEPFVRHHTATAATWATAGARPGPTERTLMANPMIERYLAARKAAVARGDRGLTAEIDLALSRVGYRPEAPEASAERAGQALDAQAQPRRGRPPVRRDASAE